MKLLFVAVAAAALVPAAVQAQEGQTEERRVVVMAGPGHRMEIGEEGLTREAFLARHQGMFARLDADSNGVVTREEMAAMAEAHGDGPMRFRLQGPEGEGPMFFHGEGGPGEHDVVIIRRGPDGETVNVEGPGGGEWVSEDGERRIVIRQHGPDGGEGGERHVMVFRHGAEGGLDSDGDGRWTFEEMVAPMREHFNQLDANGDGFVDEAERRH